MTILFINPSLRLGSPTKLLPVGITSVMTFLHEHGYEFDLLDIDVNDHDDQYVEDYVTRNRYDVIMTGSIATHYKWMKWLTHTIKKHHPDTKIVVGNSVGGSIPELFLRKSKADVVVIGEGEFGALEVLRVFENGGRLQDVAGIAFLDDEGRFHKTPKRKACKIDDLPVVDWDLLDVQNYFNKSDCAMAEGLVFDEHNPPRVMPMSTARGCVYHCTFCHHVFWEDPYRYRSPEGVLKEAGRNIERYGATYIGFWDDLSFSSLKQAEILADAILRSGLKFSWNAPTRVDLFGNPRFSRKRRVEVAEKLKAAGCLNLGFSLESGNQPILDMMNKHVNVDYFCEQVRVLKEVGITCSTSVVFGYPIETAETIRETFDICLETGLYPSIGFLLPLPGTAMYEYARQHGFITDEDAYLDSITERQDICLNMTSMSDEEIMDCIKHGASELNRAFDLGLTEDRLVRTGGYRNHAKKTANQRNCRIDPEHLKRNQNDVSFNYSQALFNADRSVDTQT